METISSLTSRHAQNGAICWIGIRPQRLEPLVTKDRVTCTPMGLEGDHYSSGGKRSVTLIQQEHITVIAALLGKQSIPPESLRRNLVISGINLLGLRNRHFTIGNTHLEGTGICAPCSRMEEIFGPGGYTAVRGHGGITARIIEAGEIRINDAVMPL